MKFAEDKQLGFVCPAFSEFVWLKHSFGTRHSPKSFAVTLRQIHSNIVRNAENLEDRQEEGDALVTNRIGQTIGIRTADCVPILLVQRETRAVAAIHAGWRGTAAQIVSNAIEKLLTDYGGSAGEIYAAIGPSIRLCCYEVSPDVAQRFSDWPEAVQAGNTSKPHIDLAKANTLQMIASGVRPELIFDSELCTACRTDLFFSFRREPENPGRMLSVIGTI